MSERSELGTDALDELVGSLRPRRAAFTPTGDAEVGLRGPAIVDAGTRRRWARTLAISLGAVALSGFVTDAMAAAQLLGDAGPEWLALVWPLGGLGLATTAAMQSRYVDRLARLPMLRALLLGYAAAFCVVGVLFATALPTGLAAALAWLLADQLNFLVPLLVWALAGDVFSAGQAVTTFPWISRLQYAGQVGGMAVATVAPWLFGGDGRSLAWLLAIPLVVCAAVAVGLPRALRGATTGAGHGRVQTSGQSIRATIAFVRELPAFRWLLRTSFAVLAAGIVIEFALLDVATGSIAGPGDLQTFYAGTALAGFVACWLVQLLITPRVLRRRGIARSLAVLPAFTIGAAAVAVAAGATENLAAAVVGVLLWRVPRWSLDASARQSALALLPDEQRARSSLLLDLAPLAVALVLVPIPIGLGRLAGVHLLGPALALALAVAAATTATEVVRRWDDTQLSWRLKRRKRLT